VAEAHRSVPRSARIAEAFAGAILRSGGWVAPLVLFFSAGWLAWQAASGRGEDWGRVFGWFAGSAVLGVAGICLALPPALAGALLSRRIPMATFARIASAMPLSVPAFMILRRLGPMVSQAWGVPAQHPAWAVVALGWGLAMPLWIAFADALERQTVREWVDGALALGANPQRILWTLSLPAALPSMGAALMRAVARASGETMAVLLVSGNFSSSWGGADGASSVGVALALDLPEATGGGGLWTDLLRGAVLLSLWTMTLHGLALRLEPVDSEGASE